MTPRLHEAMEYAFALHGWDARKGSPVPVVAHLFGVCAIVQHDGGDEDEAIAALLHDALEDKPGQVTEEMLRRQYGDRVLAMVLAATDTPRGWDGTTPKPPWRERKAAYLAHVRTSDPTLLRPTIADKIDNVRAILADYKRLGPEMFGKFNAGVKDQVWYYRECLRAYRATGAFPLLVQTLGQLVEQLQKRSRGPSPAKDTASTALPVLVADQGPVDHEYVNAGWASWLARHDSWTRAFLAPAIGSRQSTFADILPELGAVGLEDWRVGLAFFVDRTTFQSRRDTLNEKSARYLFRGILDLPPAYSADAVAGLVRELRERKRAGAVTHLRMDRDIDRLESVGAHLASSQEKNLTRAVLELVAQGVDPMSFLMRFRFVGQKTAAFYLKFMSIVYSLPIEPVTVDTHVIRQLVRHGVIPAPGSHSQAVGAIRAIAGRLGTTPVRVESALYEHGWQEFNHPQRWHPVAPDRESSPPTE